MANFNDPRLIETLRLLLWLAQRAYWTGKQDCGSDFDPVGVCVDCQHFETCNANTVIIRNISRLEAEGG